MKKNEKNSRGFFLSAEHKRKMEKICFQVSFERVE